MVIIIYIVQWFWNTYFENFWIKSVKNFYILDIKLLYLSVFLKYIKLK